MQHSSCLQAVSTVMFHWCPAAGLCRSDLHGMRYDAACCFKSFHCVKKAVGADLYKPKPLPQMPELIAQKPSGWTALPPGIFCAGFGSGGRICSWLAAEWPSRIELVFCYSKVPAGRLAMHENVFVSFDWMHGSKRRQPSRGSWARNVTSM